jgi:Protein of unknown function (DUF2490)
LIPVGILLCIGALSASAEDTTNQFWPQIEGYYNLNAISRLSLVAGFKNHEEEGSWQGTFGFNLDFALRPVFRRDLRTRDDVFNRRYLSFRAGYQYRTTLDPSAPYNENRIVLETTSRYLLPGKVVISDRNRGDLRFIGGKPFSTRYRNMLQVERDLRLAKRVFTPYANAEVFWDSRYDAWVREQYAGGVQIPLRGTNVLDVYYLRQNNTQSTPRFVNVLGATFQFYFGAR